MNFQGKCFIDEIENIARKLEWISISSLNIYVYTDKAQSYIASYSFVYINKGLSFHLLLLSRQNNHEAPTNASITLGIDFVMNYQEIVLIKEL
ncbi:hypothetical protein BK726_01850 [Bacillus thuringiensis serovar londrina]|nr:hypothetical protein BUM91_28165 [Bacillus thuringiensis]OTX95285.1 hypothetical protein BK726_02285 [Bacillus thuringiensis serovar londrina]OTX95994.1 hypothetical protein BK726_02065 [Bacillus thuringiensis serovar londrina]OTX96415.1 hypothetical protein BK726_01850 [Bacillus thuringiensis serovar londrina]